MDFFVIPKHSPWIDENILQDNQLKQKLLDYTQDLDNNIVEVYYIDDEMIITKFYPNLYPSIIKSSTNWYTEDIFKKRSDIHFNCFRDKEYAKNFHNKIVDEYKRFNNETGFFFSDIGPNNTLVDDDYSDFKIVDIASIRVGDPDEFTSFSMVITGNGTNDMGFVDVNKLVESWKKNLFQMHIMWYESKMINETLDSLSEALQYSKFPTEIRICLNSQTYLEKPIEGRAEDMFDEFKKHPILKSAIIITKTDDEPFYNIGDWRREQYNEDGYTIWGEGDCLLPYDLFYIIENVEIDHPHTLSFSSRKMWDETWEEVEFVGLDKFSSPKRFIEGDSRPVAPHNLVSGNGHTINQIQLNEINEEQDDVNVIRLKQNKIDGSLFILSPGLPKFIPDDMNFVREDTCAQVVFSEYKIPQYHVKNRLKAHNYYHPLKRVNTKETRNDEIWKQFERKSTDSMNKFLSNLFRGK